MSTTKRRIVVGADGSDQSDAAIRWADEQARLTGSTVTVLTAWHWPVTVGAPMGGMAVAQLDLEGDARAIAEKAAAGLTVPPDSVEIKVVEGPAGPSLVKAAENADLLVVGSQGHNPVGSILLGSVSAYCVHHARIPVVVVR